MDGMQIALPIVGIVAAAAVTFYAVSFAEIREVTNINYISTSTMLYIYISLSLFIHQNNPI